MKTLSPYLILFVAGATQVLADQAKKIEANKMAEWTLPSQKTYDKPFDEVQLDAVFKAPDGQEFRVPGFWAGEQKWKVRYASGQAGKHTFKTVCSDETNPDLHGITGDLDVKAYKGTNPLYVHGPIRIAGSHRTFEHADGTPFFWLADTWWMGLTKRLVWPEEFKTLTTDRIEKGFTVVQIIAGLYPDMPAFDERGANNAGFPWQKDYSRINPEYFDEADTKLAWLVESGLSPCIVGAWGYHLPWMGIEKLKQHWHYLVARYGAYPVFWCLAGEGTMPYYLSETKEKDAGLQKEGWTEIGKYVRGIDPFHHPVSIHPSQSARATVADITVLDFDMLQTGHGDRASMPQMVEVVRAARQADPPMPAINSEVAYEGILDTCYDEIQRFACWTSLMQGMAGHTYGANGIWQLNRKDQPYGPSPHGGNWGNTPWDEAMRLPGSKQVGLARRLLERYPWSKFEPHPEWATLNTAEQKKVPWGDWIWFPEGAPAKHAPVGDYFFRKTFDAQKSKPNSAVLHLAVDNRLTAFVNGTKVGAAGGFQAARVIDVTSAIRSGPNVITIAAQNLDASVEKNPAGLLCTLSLVYPGGKEQVISSDKTWRCSREAPEGWEKVSFNDESWPNAMIAAKVGDPPWGTPTQGQEFQTAYPAGIPNEVRIIYLPGAYQCTVHKIESGTAYRAKFVNPINLEATPAWQVTPEKNGDWTAPPPPRGGHDWLLILEKDPSAINPDK